MLSLHPSLLICGLVQLLSLNQTVTVHDALVFARVGTLVTAATRATDLTRYLNLQLRNEPYPISHHFLIDPPPVEIRTPTDVVLYAAPVGAYAWYSSPTLRQTVYSGIAEAKSLAIRLRNTISFLSRRRPRHALVSPHSPTPLFNESSRGGASGQLVSLNDFIRLSDESKATGIPVNLIPLRRTPFGPHISSLRRFLLRSDVSVNSGLDFCGFGAGALHPSTLDPAPVAPLALQANMSSLSGLAWCGIGTETLAKDPIPSVVAPFLHPNSSTVSRLDSCGLGTTPAPSVLVPALGFDMSTPPALSWRSLGTKVELSIPVYVPTPEFAMLICSLDMDDVEFCPRTPEDSCIELSAPGFIWLVYICVKVAPIVFVHCAWVFLDIAYRFASCLFGVLRCASDRTVGQILYEVDLVYTAFLGVAGACASVLTRIFMWVAWVVAWLMVTWGTLWPRKRGRST